MYSRDKAMRPAYESEFSFKWSLPRRTYRWDGFCDRLVPSGWLKPGWICQSLLPSNFRRRKLCITRYFQTNIISVAFCCKRFSEKEQCVMASWVSLAVVRKRTSLSPSPKEALALMRIMILIFIPHLIIMLQEKEPSPYQFSLTTPMTTLTLIMIISLTTMKIVMINIIMKTFLIIYHLSKASLSCDKLEKLVGRLQNSKFLPVLLLQRLQKSPPPSSSSSLTSTESSTS